MPNRMLRDWTDSAKMEKLSAEAERLFVRLLMKADDFGRYHAELRLIVGACFPLVREATERNVSAWLDELLRAKLVTMYHVDGRNYLEIPNFNQRLRTKSGKFPPPCGQSADICPQPAVICPRDDSNPPLEEKRREEKKKGTAAFDPLALPEDLNAIQGLADAWGRWIEYRKESKAKSTPTSCKLQHDFLRERKADAVAILTQSMMNGWRGLFELKEQARGTPSKPKQLRSEDLI